MSSLKTFHISAIVNGRPGEFTTQATCEVAALAIAKASLPKKMRIQNAQFCVTQTTYAVQRARVAAQPVLPLREQVKRFSKS